MLLFVCWDIAAEITVEKFDAFTFAAICAGSDEEKTSKVTETPSVLLLPRLILLKVLHCPVEPHTEDITTSAEDVPSPKAPAMLDLNAAAP